MKSISILIRISKHFTSHELIQVKRKAEKAWLVTKNTILNIQQKGTILEILLAFGQIIKSNDTIFI
jgi:hypothetical protein